MTCRNITFYIWAGWISVIINTYHDSRVGRFEPTKYFHVIVMLYVYICASMLRLCTTFPLFLVMGRLLFLSG